METATTPMQSKPLVNVTCKLGTKGCFKDGRCHYIGNCENKIETNADRIRAMSDEDLKDSILAVHLGYNPWCDYHCENKGDDGCDRCIEKWLKQPAEEGADK